MLQPPQTKSATPQQQLHSMVSQFVFVRVSSKDVVPYPEALCEVLSLFAVIAEPVMRVVVSYTGSAWKKFQGQDV